MQDLSPNERVNYANKHVSKQDVYVVCYCTYLCSRTSLFSSGIRGHNNSSVASEVWTLEHEGPENFGIQKLVKGLPILKHSAKLCTDCIVGKQHCDNFPKKSLWRAYQPLQLMHSDICGLITPESNSHKRYILTFIDDYSRKMWTYFLYAKSEAFTMFKNFKSMIEKEKRNYISCLRTD